MFKYVPSPKSLCTTDQSWQKLNMKKIKRRNRSKWVVEFFTPYEKYLYKVKRFIVKQQTKFQKAQIVDTYKYGRCLILDGELQSAESDEFIYHEALVHPTIVTSSKPRKVVILGGGEGATLREILRYKSVESVTMVDLDEEVVRFCKKYLLQWHQGAFNDKRVSLVFEDARKYLSTNDRKVDIIFSDLSNPIKNGPARFLYTLEFYQLVFNRLNNDGIFALQAGTSDLQQIGLHASIYTTLKKIFPIVETYYAFVPSFCTAWAFAIASKQYNPKTIPIAQIKRKIKKIRRQLKFYDENIHYSLFVKPKYLDLLLSKNKVITTDKNPFDFFK